MTMHRSQFNFPDRPDQWTQTTARLREAFQMAAVKVEDYSSAQSISSDSGWDRVSRELYDLTAKIAQNAKAGIIADAPSPQELLILVRVIAHNLKCSGVVAEEIIRRWDIAPEHFDLEGFSREIEDAINNDGPVTPVRHAQTSSCALLYNKTGYTWRITDIHENDRNAHYALLLANEGSAELIYRHFKGIAEQHGLYREVELKIFEINGLSYYSVQLSAKLLSERWFKNAELKIDFGHDGQDDSVIQSYAAQIPIGRDPAVKSLAMHDLISVTGRLIEDSTTRSALRELRLGFDVPAWLIDKVLDVTDPSNPIERPFAFKFRNTRAAEVFKKTLDQISLLVPGMHEVDYEIIAGSRDYQGAFVAIPEVLAKSAIWRETIRASAHLRQYLYRIIELDESLGFDDPNSQFGDVYSKYQNPSGRYLPQRDESTLPKSRDRLTDDIFRRAIVVFDEVANISISLPHQTSTRRSTILTKAELLGELKKISIVEMSCNPQATAGIVRQLIEDVFHEVEVLTGRQVSISSDANITLISRLQSAISQACAEQVEEYKKILALAKAKAFVPSPAVQDNQVEPL